MSMDVGTREITVTWQVLSSQQYHVRFVPTGSVSRHGCVKMWILPELVGGLIFGSTCGSCVKPFLFNKLILFFIFERLQSAFFKLIYFI